jgi:hypothetical protein
MSEFKDPRDAFAEGLRGDMPPVPSAAVLERTHAEAIARDGHRRVRLPSRRWQLGIALAAAAGVLALAWGVVAPRVETMAFARERAAQAAAIVSDGSAMHVVVRFTESSWNEQYGHQPEFDHDEQWSEWLDRAGGRDRWEVANLHGVLEETTLRVGDRELWLAGIATKKPELFESKMKGKPLPGTLASTAEAIREGIADGSAKVTGSEVIDGDDCWVVKLGEPAMPDGSGKTITTVKLRKSDYRPKSWEAVSTGKNGNGNCSDTSKMTFLTWEKLEPSAVPAGIFSFDDVMSLAPAGIKIEKRDLPM